MTDSVPVPLTRQAASAAVTDLGWRLVLRFLRTEISVDSLAQAVEVASTVVEAAGPGAGLQLDVRADALTLSLQRPEIYHVTARETEAAARISAAVAALGLATRPGARPVQLLEIAIDALDIAKVRPFWKAVLGYGDRPGAEDPMDDIVDPAGLGPSVWFQRMDAPRPQRNRIHIDISVPHDEAPARLEATIAAGGRLLTDQWAPAFWVLADPEGNEVCICTWQARD